MFAASAALYSGYGERATFSNLKSFGLETIQEIVRKDGLSLLAVNIQTEPNLRGHAMDKLARYREIIKHVLQKHVASANRRPQPGVERFMIADETRDHYFLFSLGWVADSGCGNFSVYVRETRQPVGLVHDLTEGGLANELLAAGVPAADIVLAFQHPQERLLTEAAAA